MGLLKRTIQVVEWSIAGYLAWQKVQTLIQMRDQFYADLPPQLQAEYDQYFGKPVPGGALPFSMPSLPTVNFTAPTATTAAAAPATSAQNLVAGT